MTLGRLAIAATVALVAGSIGGFVASGSLLVGMGVLVAPIPSLVVHGLLSERADWTLGEWRRRSSPEDAAVADDLHAALEARPSTRLPEAADDLYLPDCPALPSPEQAPASGPPDDMERA
ncbi:MAG: hypothetical protein AAF845_03810 [Bacteroidota bacterium]